MDQLITLTIDGKQVSVPAGSTVLDAARALGIEIPTLCHYKKLIPIGACRVCLVEIEKMRGLQPACSSQVRPDMVVHTDTADVHKARTSAIEFLLTNHPLDCPVCDKGGECDLQDFTFSFGPGWSRFVEEKRHKAKARILGEHVVMDQERCVLCRRCIRFMEEWSGEPELGIIERGRLSHVDTFYDEPLQSSFAGNVIQVCPVGALTSRTFRFSARCWELKSTDSICLNCAVGCNVSLQSKANHLKRVAARENAEVNDEWLCDRGQFAHSFAQAEGRLLQPMVRVGDALQPASWEDALRLVTSRLNEIVAAEGSGAVAAIGSAKASNEANYLLQRMLRGCLHSNNVAFEGQPPARAYLLPTTRVLDRAGAVLVVGMDLADEAPLLELLGRHGGLGGCTRFVAVHPTRTRLADFGLWLGAPAGRETVVLNGLAHLLGRKQTSGANGADSLKGWVADFTPARVAAATGLSVADLEAAAALLAGATPRAVLYGAGAQQNAELMKAVGNLAALLGCDGAAFVPTQANAIGALDMGVSPASLPGGQSYDDQRVVDRLIQLWGRSKPPRDAGLSLDSLRAAAGAGSLKAVYCLGQVPAGLEVVDFLVVQTSRLSDVPASAAVVLPEASHAEAEGTFTNLCGLVQVAHAGLRPMGESRPAWQILSQIGAGFGKADGWEFASVEEVFAEIGKCVPAYAGLSYAVLGSAGKARQSDAARLVMMEAKAAL